jgi:hypothetical protein
MRLTITDDKYLTAVDKRNIKIILSKGLLEGHVSRKDYFLKSNGDGKYTVNIREDKKSGWYTGNGKNTAEIRITE